MVRLLQNKIAESRLALPVTAVYALAIWLAAGAATQGWWLQLGCFAVSSFLMLELNSIHALIRIYSRMVTCSFIVISCITCFCFPSLQGGLTQMLLIASMMVLFTSYQDHQATGRTYYAFLLWGLASLLAPQACFFVPLLWILMGTCLMCLSWASWGASVLGLLTPYWLWAGWLALQGDFTPLTNLAAQLTDLHSPFDYSALTLPHMLSFGFMVLLMLTGTVHFLSKSYGGDKIRTRMFFSCFICIDLLASLFMVLQPQHYDLLMRIMTITTAPLIAHFVALTHTRLTNVIFLTMTGLTVLLTLFNLLWTT